MKNELINFINSNFEEISNLSKSEIMILELEENDKEIIEYLKSQPNYRFDYNCICICWVEEENEVWVENMLGYNLDKII
jgi:hypothetical protein